MSREHLARARPPQYHNPAVISAMPQWASPLSPSPTPPRQPVVYLTGNHVVPDVGLGTTVVEPPMSVVEPPTTAVIPPGVVRTTIAALEAVAAGGSAVEAPTTVVEARTTAVVAAQTDPMEFPFVAYPRGTKWWLK